MRSGRLFAKTSDKLRRELKRGERVTNLDFASIMNPLWDIPLFLPVLVLVWFKHWNALAIPILFLYLMAVFMFLRTKSRLLVFTNQRVMIYLVTGLFGRRYELFREVPEEPTPIGTFKGWWKRTDSFGERLWVQRT